LELAESATLDFDLARGAEAMHVIPMGQAPQVVKQDASDGYVGEIRYVVDCARFGKRPTTVTALDGVSALEICEAEEKSVRTGQLVLM
jgi:predicted dehydrogenase